MSPGKDRDDLDDLLLLLDNRLLSSFLLSFSSFSTLYFNSVISLIIFSFSSYNSFSFFSFSSYYFFSSRSIIFYFLFCSCNSTSKLSPNLCSSDIFKAFLNTSMCFYFSNNAEWPPFRFDLWLWCYIWSGWFILF